jgi:hypothetical protein
MKMPKTYRAFVDMTFEPDENGYLEWEGGYDLDPEALAEEGYEPRTEEEMKRFFADELWEYLMNNLEYEAIYVEEVKE